MLRIHNRPFCRRRTPPNDDDRTEFTQKCLPLLLRFPDSSLTLHFAERHELSLEGLYHYTNSQQGEAT